MVRYFSKASQVVHPKGNMRQVTSFGNMRQVDEPIYILGD